VVRLDAGGTCVLLVVGNLVEVRYEIAGGLEGDVDVVCKEAVDLVIVEVLRAAPDLVVVEAERVGCVNSVRRADLPICREIRPA
jgi:hypothetical protein